MSYKITPNENLAKQRTKGPDFVPTDEGKVALKKINRAEAKGNKEVVRAEVKVGKAINYGGTLNKEQLQKRIEKCKANDICFISLKPLEGKGVLIDGATILPQYLTIKP